MTLTQRQAIDMLTQYRELNVNIKCVIDGEAHRLATTDIDEFIRLIIAGAYNNYCCGLRTLLLSSPYSNKYDALISIDVA